jgi:hypothetical protein
VTGRGKVNSRVCWEINISRFGSWKDRSFDITSTKILDRRSLDKEGKGSALTVVKFHGFETPALYHWIREVTKSDIQTIKRGSREDCCGCRFFDREIEDP